MKLERLMKEYYAAEVARRTVPAPATAPAATPLWLQLVFNGAVAALFIFALAGHLAYRCPLEAVFSTVNQKYGIDAAVLRELDRLPGRFTTNRSF